MRYQPGDISLNKTIGQLTFFAHISKNYRSLHSAMSHITKSLIQLTFLTDRYN